MVFSEETVWDPYFQPDPQYHYDGIMDSLKKAAAHLPRVDAIGGSAAGVYVNNRVKVASLFRGVPPDVFNQRVRDLFLDIRKAWNNVPLEVVNDGEVTALAGSMSLGKNRILGISLGTSTAGGYVNAEGNITSWINELAFVPVDYNPRRRPTSGPATTAAACNISRSNAWDACSRPRASRWTPKLPLPEKLKHVQKLMDQGDYRARKIYQTIGTYLGYAIAHFTDFYDLENVLILGRVTSGPGGDIIIAGAKEVLKAGVPRADRQDRLPYPRREGQAARPGGRGGEPARYHRTSEHNYDPLSSTRIRLRAPAQRRPLLPTGHLQARPRPAIPPNAPKALFFAPHPDDECIVGGMAVRLMRQARMNLINVAVTLGSKKERQQERLRELQNACNYLGFGLVTTAPNGLEKINPKTREQDPKHWAACVKIIKDHHRSSTSRRWCSARTTATGTARTSARITW